MTDLKRWHTIIKKTEHLPEVFARMFAEAPLSMCILKGPQHVFEDANENYSILTGRRDLKGKTAREMFPELADQGFFHWLDEVYGSGETFTGHETPLTVDLHGDGTLTTRYINFIYQPYFDSEGKVEGIFYFGTDVTEQVEMRKKLEQNEKRFRALIENSYDILVLFDQEGTRKYVSPAFERTLGYQQSEVIGDRVFDKVHPDDTGTLYTVVTNAFENPGAAIEACARFKKKDGNYAWLEGYITNMLHVEEVNALVINFRNIDERKKIEQQAENYSKRIGVILESITDPFYTIDNNYTITYWNQKAAKLLGVDKKAILGKSLWDVFPIAKELKFFTEYEKALKENRSARFEVFYPPTNMWFDVSAYPLDEGLGIYIRDITDAKKNYQDLVKTETDVRNFARQLNSMLEEERSRIAREIHDEFGQQLAAIKMSVAFSKLLLEGNEEVKQKLDEISLDIDNTMNSLRSFATELRPGILDTMGLIPSLEWLAKEFEKKTGVNCYLDADTNEQDLEKALATCYFRICQEALTNVLKHAQAKNVVIQVFKENNELILNIMDDGIGIVEEKIQNPFSMGILGMKERANLIGGTLSILKGSNGGTTVQLKAKIHAE